MRWILLTLVVSGCGASWPVSIAAEEFDITKLGAIANDDKDDTRAIQAALNACKKQGGVVVIPAGTFLVSRQGTESPILEIPSETTVRGVGDDSILKFVDGVNQSNFWRMLGAGKSCKNILIEKVHLDGSNRLNRYEKGKTPEQNHGIFFYCKAGTIECVTVRDCLIENFSGDCVSFSRGCRGFTITDVRVRNFLRQGIQMGGGKGDGGHVVTKCRDLRHTVEPGGSTIHVEHAEGASDFRIYDNVCRHHLLAGGGAEQLIVKDNIIHGRVEGNGIKNGVFENNKIIAGSGTRPLMQFGYAKGLIVRKNTLLGKESATTGIYIWGASRYNPLPSMHITVETNHLMVKGQPIHFNGVTNAIIRDNRIEGSNSSNNVLQQRTVNVKVADN